MVVDDDVDELQQAAVHHSRNLPITYFWHEMLEMFPRTHAQKCIKILWQIWCFVAATFPLQPYNYIAHTAAQISDSNTTHRYVTKYTRY